MVRGHLNSKPLPSVGRGVGDGLEPRSEFERCPIEDHQIQLGGGKGIGLRRCASGK